MWVLSFLFPTSNLISCFSKQDDDFLVKYNDALTRYGRDDFESAERKFRNLLESEYFKQCGYESQKPRPIAVKLQYNSYR